MQLVRIEPMSIYIIKNQNFWYHNFITYYTVRESNPRQIYTNHESDQACNDLCKQTK